MNEPAVALVKLGGSLVTDKGRPGTPRPGRIRRLAAEVAAALDRLPDGLVVGHGSGSYGHVAAARHGLGGPGGGSVSGQTGRRGVWETQARAAALHRLVLAALRRAGVPAFSVAPSAAAVAAAGRPADMFAEPVALALRLGLVPVVYGDVVLDRERGASILSTEAVLAELARRLPGLGRPAGRALWAGATEGILDARGNAIPEVRRSSPGAAREAAGGSEATDVTGGMAHRLEVALELAGLGIPSWIGDGTVPGRLGAALRGAEVPGTRVIP